MENSNQPITPILDMNANLSNLIGLTKREYFAGLAIQGLLANSYISEQIRNCDNKNWIAREALENADKLLKQLENGK